MESNSVQCTIRLNRAQEMERTKRETGEDGHGAQAKRTENSFLIFI